MDKTIYTAKVDEYTVRSDVLNNTFKDLTLFKLTDDFSLLSFKFSFDKNLVRYDNILEFVVNLNNLEFHCLINVSIVIADRTYINLATWKEGFDTEYINDHTALSAALNVSLNDFVLFKSFSDKIPRASSTSLTVAKY